MDCQKIENVAAVFQWALAGSPDPSAYMLKLVRHCLCLVFPLHSWLRHCLCLVSPLPSWLRQRLCLAVHQVNDVSMLHRILSTAMQAIRHSWLTAATCVERIPAEMAYARC